MAQVLRYFHESPNKATTQQVSLLTTTLNLMNSSISSNTSAILNKLNTIPGKSVSSNDFTDYYKDKLKGIEEGAEVNVLADWNESDSTADSYIQNKPSIDTVVTENSDNLITSGAVFTAIDNLPEPMIFKGSLGVNGTILTLPSPASNNIGYTYKVITDGTYAGQTAKAGDVFISDGTDWIYIPSADEPSGTVTNIAMTVPTGLEVSGSPISTSGTFAITYAIGYAIPTLTDQAAWTAKQDAISDLSTIRSRADEGHTAYGWGDHANAGYLTAISDLATIRSRADEGHTAYNSLSDYLPLTGGTLYIPSDSSREVLLKLSSFANNGLSSVYVNFENSGNLRGSIGYDSNSYTRGIAITNATARTGIELLDDGNFYHTCPVNPNSSTITRYKIWHEGNDGSASGLDADLLDGYHASSFALSGHTHSYLPLSGGTLTGTLNTNSDIKITGYNNRIFGFCLTNGGTAVGDNVDVGWNWSNVDGSGAYFRSTDAGGSFGFYARSTSSNTKQLIGTTGGSLKWDGNELATLTWVSSNYSASGHTHSYLPLSGGTMTGQLRVNAGSAAFGPSLDDSTYKYYHAVYLGTHGVDTMSVYEQSIYLYANGGGTPNVYIGGNKAWHAGNDGSGSGLDADLLDGLHSDYFQVRHWSTQRDFGSGTLIKTDIKYNVREGDPFYVVIQGNTYTRYNSCLTQIQGYIYSDTIIHYGVTHLGAHPITGIIAMLIDENLCFWFPRQGYWEGYSIEVYSAYNYRLNRVTSVTDSADPGGSKRVALNSNTITTLNSSNYSSYALPLSGGTVTGNLTVTGSGGIRSTGLILSKKDDQYGLGFFYSNSNGYGTMGLYKPDTTTSLLRGISFKYDTSMHVSIGGGTPNTSYNMNTGTLLATDITFSNLKAVNSSSFAIDSYGTFYFNNDGGSSGLWGIINNKSGGSGWAFLINSNNNATLAGTLTLNSDIRLKRIIDDYNISVESIASAPLFKFRWKNGDDDTEYVGTSALYWLEITPELVSEAEDDSNTLSLQYGTLGVVNSITIAKEVVSLKEEIKLLRALIAELKLLLNN